MGGSLDEHVTNPNYWVQTLKDVFERQPYNQVFDLLQFILRNTHCPASLAEAISGALESHQAAYRLVEEDTFVPISTQEEGAAIVKAFQEVERGEFSGAKTHLKNAAIRLNQGKFADSVRESIHAVESAAKVLSGDDSANLTDALRTLEKAGLKIHAGFKLGLEKMYGYTSDEKGVRHALIESESRVDEADAQFMFGACASFLSYLISKARLAGLPSA
jgi:hypothetical protein